MEGVDEEAIQVISRHNEINCKYKLDKLYVFVLFI